jgi:hypothetical protein
MPGKHCSKAYFSAAVDGEIAAEFDGDSAVTGCSEGRIGRLSSQVDGVHIIVESLTMFAKESGLDVWSTQACPTEDVSIWRPFIFFLSGQNRPDFKLLHASIPQTSDDQSVLFE